MHNGSAWPKKCLMTMANGFVDIDKVYFSSPKQATYGRKCLNKYRTLVAQTHAKRHESPHFLVVLFKDLLVPTMHGRGDGGHEYESPITTIL